MLQITENEILEAYDSYELSESELIELYSEGYISENTMDQLIEMGVFDETLEEGVLKRHKTGIKLGAAGGGAAGMAIGGALGGPIGAGIGGTLGLGAGAIAAAIRGRKIDKNKLNAIKSYRKEAKDLHKQYDQDHYEYRVARDLYNHTKHLNIPSDYGDVSTKNFINSTQRVSDTGAKIAAARINARNVKKGISKRISGKALGDRSINADDPVVSYKFFKHELN